MGAEILKDLINRLGRRTQGSMLPKRVKKLAHCPLGYFFDVRVSASLVRQMFPEKLS